MIRDEFLELVKNGHKFKIDFKNKVIKVNNKNLLDKYDGSNYWEKPSNIIDELRSLYLDYYYSYPSIKRNRSVIKAASFIKLTDDQLATGIDRWYTRARLESYILGLTLEFKFKDLDPDESHWFYKDSIDNNLIIFKEWFDE